ncbi:MAG: class I SAM-dependent methyltransferase [Desulfitobacteriaceae bacterium]|nr:class I SAM-dependent methyltransferase [Desulfitobacteriaceae bacterium]MDD4346125.1 class I SAM-dependent methyltransferase [Desulfitobacteriaceae bacterium]MDD4401085.1 class I SAM-dependent methyltransferase [Desulfitobacteriaceae bacterium]
MRELRDIQGLLRAFLQPLILPGDKVMDATAGRGRDTLFLSECVGPTGKVYALDIQEQALAETHRLLSDKGMADRVAFVLPRPCPLSGGCYGPAACRDL